MKRILPLAAIAAGLWLAAQTASTPRPLNELVPAGAMVYLEAKNFQSLVSAGKTSPEKASWLGSANYQVFSRSLLYGRLEGVFQEYATGIGVAPNLDLLSSVAGTETALAVYDINRIEFLYLTRLPSARAMESLLWSARAQFTARNAAGQAYYAKTDPQSKRTACFAVSGDWLLVATKEDALTGALSLLTGGNAVPVRREAWFDAALRAAPQAGELRMVMNMPRLASAAAFRSYWIQRNGPELRQYSAAISDLQRSAAGYREDRVLLRPEAAPAPDATAVASLSVLAPPGAGLYRIWAQPPAAAVAQMVRRKITGRGPAAATGSKTAPGVSLDAALTGTESDLESRLDEAPYDFSGAPSSRLAEFAAANPARAMLYVQSSRLLSDGVFIGNDSAVVIEATNDWTSPPALDESFTAVRGKRLYVATRRELLDELLARSAGPAIDATYAAAIRLNAEAPRFQQLTRMIERSDPNISASAEPRFFSENLSSLAATWKRLQSVEIRETDSGNLVKQTVAYRLAP